MRYFKHFWNLTRHKWYVLVAGMRLGVPLSILALHDWDKYMPRTFVTNVEHYYDKTGKVKITIDEIFLGNYIEHRYSSKHHWEYWCRPTPKPIPEVFLREMLADWLAVGRMMHGKWDTENWILTNMNVMRLHKVTELRLLELLAQFKIKIRKEV